MDVTQNGLDSTDQEFYRGWGWECTKEEPEHNRVTKDDLQGRSCPISLDSLSSRYHIVRVPLENDRHLFLSREGIYGSSKEYDPSHVLFTLICKVRKYGVVAYENYFIDCIYLVNSSVSLEVVYKWLPDIDYIPSSVNTDSRRWVFKYDCPIGRKPREIELEAVYTIEDQKIYHFVLCDNILTIADYFNSSRKESFKRSIVKCIAPCIKLIEATHGKYTKYNPLVVFCRNMIVFAERTEKYALATTITKIVGIATKGFVSCVIPAVHCLYILGLCMKIIYLLEEDDLLSSNFFIVTATTIVTIGIHFFMFEKVTDILY